jgi:hypothetical protein
MKRLRRWVLDLLVTASVLMFITFAIGGALSYSHNIFLKFGNTGTVYTIHGFWFFDWREFRAGVYKIDSNGHLVILSQGARITPTFGPGLFVNSPSPSLPFGHVRQFEMRSGPFADPPLGAVYQGLARHGSRPTAGTIGWGWNAYAPSCPRSAWPLFAAAFVPRA